MSKDLHRSCRQHRLETVCCGFAILFAAGCAAENATAPEEFERYSSSARGYFTLYCSEVSAIQFDGIDDYIDASADPIGTPENLTVEAWVRIDESGKPHVLVTDASDDFNDGFTLVVDTENRVKFIVAASASSRGEAVAATALDLDRWYHVAGVYDGTDQTIKVVIDGAEDASSDYQGGITFADTRDLLFGSQVKSYGRDARYLQGAVADVRIWSRARSAGEIAADMDGQPDAADEDLVGYWPMQEGEGSTTADVSGADNTGSLEGEPAWIEARFGECDGEMSIDVKPGGDPDAPKPVNLNPGNVPVAILSAPEFDVTTMLDVTTLTFGHTGEESSMHRRGNGEPNCAPQDVNEDGLPDLVCHFITSRTGLQPGHSEVILKGYTVADAFRAADMPVSASDAVTVKRSSSGNPD
jgi:hypothetical protein